MVLFTVIKIAVVSLLLIYAGHLVWGYYTGETKSSSSLPGSDDRSGSSALRDSKRMYEEMARTIKLGNPVTKNEYNSNSNTIVTPQPTYSSPIIDLPVLDDSNQTIHESEDMQRELQTYMDNLT